MEPIQVNKLFDIVSRKRRSRRQALKEAVGLAVTAGAVAGGVNAAAQESTPVPGEFDPSQKPDMLFVQSFSGGSIVARDGEAGAYTVTLQHDLGETIYFTDRPGRIVGTTPTEQFVQVFGFGPENPPNAALVITNEAGETDIAVVELTNPSYDGASNTATYDIQVLENFDDYDHAFQVDPVDLADVAASFGSAHLFIDDCEDTAIHCKDVATGVGYLLSSYGLVPACFQWGICQPCEPYFHTSPSPCATFFYWADICDQHAEVCKSRNCWPTWRNSASGMDPDKYLDCP